MDVEGSNLCTSELVMEVMMCCRGEARSEVWRGRWLVDVLSYLHELV